MDERPDGVRSQLETLSLRLLTQSFPACSMYQREDGSIHAGYQSHPQHIMSG